MTNPRSASLVSSNAPNASVRFQYSLVVETLVAVYTVAPGHGSPTYSNNWYPINPTPAS